MAIPTGKLLPILFAVQILSGCAALQEAAVQQNCDRENAFQRGINDSQAGKPMNNSFSGICPQGIQEQVKAGYREGYLARTPDQDTELNSPRRRAFSCKASSPMSSHTEFGATLLEAMEKTRRLCASDHGETRCQEIHCQRDR